MYFVSTMRSLKGFDRPGVQWAFVTLAAVLAVLVASLSIALWRLNGSLRELRVARLEDRAARDALEARLAREQSTREALTLELGRLRGATASGAPAVPPTLTLEPLRRREATPPPPTMNAPAAAQVIELRLVLPRGADADAGPYELSVRDWVTGQVRLTRSGLRATRLEGRHTVTAYVPGDIFGPGSHEVILTGRGAEPASYEITARAAARPVP